MVCKCNSCKDDRPDILRSNIGIGTGGCDCGGDCMDGCENAPKESECDCPYGRFSDNCIYYNGCQTFLTSLSPGMPYNEVMANIEQVFKKMDKILDKVIEQNNLLQERVTKLEKQIGNGKKCTDFE